MKDAFNLPKAATNPKTVTPTVAAPLPSAAYPFTDTGNSERFAAAYGADLRYCSTQKKWFIWDGRRWKLDDTGRVMKMAKKLMVTLHKSAIHDYAAAAKNSPDGKMTPEMEEAVAAMKWFLGSQSKYRLDAMISLSESALPVTVDELDMDPWKLTVENGTLDLRTGVLYPPKREDLITRLAPVKYDPQALAPTWLKFLDRIMAHDPDLIAYLQRAVGYALTGSTKEQVLFILHGVGANGKSTLLAVLLTLLGDYGLTTPTETLLVKKYGSGIPNDVARLKGARLVSAIETEDGKRLAEALVKQMTGGDRISARFLYAEYFEFLPAFKLFLAVNHRPVIRDSGHAMWRRVRLIPFEVIIPDAEQDKELTSKLTKELPGILRWAVQGCLAWQEHGLKPPKAVQAATAAYRSEQDVFAQFITECCELDPAQKTVAKILYGLYQDWCQDAGRYYLPNIEFGRRLARLPGVSSTSSKGLRMWKGIGLRDDLEVPSKAPATDATDATAFPGSPIEPSALAEKLETAWNPLHPLQEGE